MVDAPSEIKFTLNQSRKAVLWSYFPARLLRSEGFVLAEEKQLQHHLEHFPSHVNPFTPIVQP